MARLLLTTFNAPGLRTGAPLTLRKSLETLVGDSLDETMPGDPDLNGKTLWEAWPAELNDMSRYVPKALPFKYAGLDSRLLSFMRWTTAWPEMFAKQKPLLTHWMAKLFSRPVHLWAIGGHHAGHASATTGGRYRAMVWYHELPALEFLPITGIGLTFDDKLELFGYRPGSKTPLTIPLPNARASLREVRLMMIFGCNGVPGKDRTNETPMSRAWQNWLSDGTRRPLILGWYNTKNMTPDLQPFAKKGEERYATNLFANKLKILAGKLPAGTADPFLAIMSTPEGARQVAQCWGAACFEAFHNVPKNVTYPSRILWTDCGALAPDQVVWHANVDKYRGVQKDPPFNLADESQLPLIRRDK